METGKRTESENSQLLAILHERAFRSQLVGSFLSVNMIGFFLAGWIFVLYGLYYLLSDSYSLTEVTTVFEDLPGPFLSSDSNKLFYFFITYVLFSFVVIYFTYTINNYASSKKDERRYLSLNQKVPTELKELLAFISEFFQLPLHKLDIRLDQRDYGVSPSINNVFGKTVLIIPVGFLKLLYEKPDTARAILAHEFGHLLQKDSNYIHFTKSYAHSIIKPSIKFVIGFFIAACAFMLLISLNGNIETFLFALLFCIIFLAVFFIALYIILHAYRFLLYRSEFVADYCGAVFTSSQTILAPLKEVAEFEKQASYFDRFFIPPIWRRIHVMEKMEKRYPALRLNSGI